MGAPHRLHHDVMPDFDEMAVGLTSNPQTRTYELLEMKRLHDLGIPDRQPHPLTMKFENACRQQGMIPMMPAPTAAWEIRNRRNSDMLDTPAPGAGLTTYKNAVPPNLYVPMATCPAKVVAGALWKWDTDHRRRKSGISYVDNSAYRGSDYF